MTDDRKTDPPLLAAEGEGHEPPTEEELREAALLARALEGPGTLGPHEDPAAIAGALGAARLLEAARRGGLDDLRERAVLAAVLGEAQQPAAAERPASPDSTAQRSPATPGLARRALRPRLLAMAGAASAAAVLLFSLTRSQQRAQLPAPTARLLQAQLAAARPGAPLGPLQQALGDHRSRLLGALEAGYGRQR
jgi:hypothetical protein